MNKLLFFTFLFVLFACGENPDSKSKTINYKNQKPPFTKGAHQIYTIKVHSQKRILI